VDGMATNDERCKEGRQESAKKPKLSEEHMASYGKEVTAPCSSSSSSSSPMRGAENLLLTYRQTRGACRGECRT